VILYAFFKILICKNFKKWNIQIQGLFKDFQGPGIFSSKFKDFQGLLKHLWTLYLRPGVFLVENRPPAAQYATIFIVNVVLSTNKALSQQSDIPDDRSRKYTRKYTLNIPVSQKLLAIHHSLVAYSDKSQVFISCDVAPPSQSYLDLKTNVKVIRGQQ